VAADTRCRPVSRVTTAGHRHDSLAFEPVMAGIRIRRRGPGRPRTRPGIVLGDKAYSSRAIRAHLRRRRITATIPEPIDQANNQIRSIIWATGLRPDFGFLSGLGDLPVFDRRGRVRHDGGVVTASPGLYVIGLPFLRRRKSTLIDGAAPDAADITAHLAAHLTTSSTEFDGRPRPAVPIDRSSTALIRSTAVEASSVSW
jgi:hypothetical protein